jgi:hypothetical protein
LIIDISRLSNKTIGKAYLIKIDSESKSVFILTETKTKKIIQARSLLTWDLKWQRCTLQKQVDFTVRLIESKENLEIHCESDNKEFFYIVNKENFQIISEVNFDAIDTPKRYFDDLYVIKKHDLVDPKTKELLEGFNEYIPDKSVQYHPYKGKDYLFLAPRRIRSSEQEYVHLIYDVKTKEIIRVETESLNNGEAFKLLGLSKSGSFLLSVHDHIARRPMMWKQFILDKFGKLKAIEGLDSQAEFKLINPSKNDDFFDMFVVSNQKDVEFRRYSDTGELLTKFTLDMPEIKLGEYRSIHSYVCYVKRVNNKYVVIHPHIKTNLVMDRNTFEVAFFERTESFNEFSTNHRLTYEDNLVIYNKKQDGAYYLGYISFDGEIPDEIQHLKECCEKAKDEELPEISTEFPW